MPTSSFDGGSHIWESVRSIIGLLSLYAVDLSYLYFLIAMSSLLPTFFVFVLFAVHFVDFYSSRTL